VSYGIDSRLARRQGKQWVGVAFDITTQHDGVVGNLATLFVTPTELFVGDAGVEPVSVGKLGNRKALAKALAAARAKAPDGYSVTLAVDDGVTYGQLVAVLELARAAGWMQAVIGGIGGGIRGGGGWGNQRGDGLGRPAR
jgi:hypothetical protein